MKTRKVNLIIPTRSVNENTLKNLNIISRIILIKEFDLNVIIVTNNILDENLTINCLKSITIIYDDNCNAALSRNRGVKNTENKTATFIFLDDDIELNLNNASLLFQAIIDNPNKSILAPYIEGHYINSNYVFGFFSRKIFSWVFNRDINWYDDVQGKTNLGIAFPPLFTQEPNTVQWIPGGCMIFNHFLKKDVLFDESIFFSNYQLEDFYLSHKMYLLGNTIEMIPIKLGHKSNYQEVSLNNTLKRFINVEKNRKQIYFILNGYNFRNNLNYSSIILIRSVYNLKNFNLRSLLLLLAVLHVIFLWKSPKL